MTAGVTSIAGARSAARRHAAVAEANNRITVLLLFVVGILIVIGLGAMLSASSVVGIEQAEGDRWYFFRRQVVWIGVGAAVLWAAARVPYHWYRRFALPIFGISVAGLVAVLLVGREAGGSRAWIDLGFTDLQPSEFAKFGTIVALASVMARKERRLTDFTHYIVPVVVIVGTVATLVMLEPDLGTALIIAAGALAVLAVSTAPMRYVLGTGVAGILAGLMMALGDAERAERLTTFLNPWADELGGGYQVLQGLGALGSGGTFGVGLGASRMRWGWIPNSHTDFIFAIIGEEIGFAGAVVILALFAMISVIGLVVAYRAPDRFGRMLAAGITAWLTAQAIVNIGGIVQVLPITGLPLPFVSFGGSALVTAMGAIGVLASIARRGVNSRGRKTA
jgi:cell division protein FtsW